MTVSTSPSPEVGQPDDIPLSIEPVLGWRVWHLVRQNEQLRLHALSHPDTWTPQEATPARCSRTSHEGAPVESCTCGPCLEQGQIVDPTSVVEDTWLIPLCTRHWHSKGVGRVPAS